MRPVKSTATPKKLRGSVLAENRDSAADSQKNSARYAEILEVATQLFYDHGYSSVGIRTIAAAVGVQPASLYYYFRSKEDILFHITLHWTQGFIETHQPLLENDGPASDVLRQVVRAHVYYFAKHGVEQRVAERELRKLSRDRITEIRLLQRRYLDKLIAVVERANKQGVLKVEHPTIATRAFLDMLNHLFRWFEPGHDLSVEQVANMYATMIVDGLLGGAVAPKSRRTHARSDACQLAGQTS